MGTIKRRSCGLSHRHHNMYNFRRTLNTSYFVILKYKQHCKQQFDTKQLENVLFYSGANRNMPCQTTVLPCWCASVVKTNKHIMTSVASFVCPTQSNVFWSYSAFIHSIRGYLQCKQYFAILWKWFVVCRARPPRVRRLCDYIVKS